MRLFLFSVLLFAEIISVVTATDFYITSPYSVISWKAGENVKVTWNLLSGGPDISAISVDLMDGADSNAHVLMPIASGLSPGATFVEWKVPADFPSTNTVFVRVSGQGNSETPVYRFSHRFAVKSAGDAVPVMPKEPLQKPSEVPKQAVVSSVANVPSATSSQGANQSAASSTTSSDYSATWPTESDSVPTASLTVLHRQVKSSAAEKSKSASFGLALVVILFIAWI